MFLLNPRASRSPYDAGLHRLLNLAAGRQARERLAAWDRIAPGSTPAWELPGLAAALGVGAVTLKDESFRSRLGSFKVLGAPNALIRLIQRRWPQAGWHAPELFAGRHAAALGEMVVITATDGNHGRALAAAAQSVGCRCVIVLHAHVSPEREQAIAAFGARIVRVAGDYDASVREAARLARENGWQVVSDTSWDGYQEVPLDVMQGYGVLADELAELDADAATCPWTHVFLQGGVGALAAGFVSNFWERWGARRPFFIVVEPEQADCLLQSALHGRPERTRGSVDSFMAGLACGETSPLAWRFMQPAVDGFVTVSDAQAEEAMRTLARGRHGDMPVVSGESGVAGLAALQAIMSGAPAHADARRAAGLDAASRVLLLSTEGATDPAVYTRTVGRTPAAVQEAQRDWLAGRGQAETRA